MPTTIPSCTSPLASDKWSDVPEELQHRSHATALLPTQHERPCVPIITLRGCVFQEIRARHGCFMQGTQRNEADPMRGGSCMIIPREVDLQQSFTAMCCATIMFQQQWPCVTCDIAPLLHVVAQMLAFVQHLQAPVYASQIRWGQANMSVSNTVSWRE